MCESVALFMSWFAVGAAALGAGLGLAAGLFLVAGLLKGAWQILNYCWGDLVAWTDLRQAVDEWMERHPDKARRYRDRTLWRNW
jgi:hypothetical protein